MQLRRRYLTLTRFLRRLRQPTYRVGSERFKMEDLTDWMVQREEWIHRRVEERPDKRLVRELRRRALPPLTGRHGDVLGENRNF